MTDSLKLLVHSFFLKVIQCTLPKEIIIKYVKIATNLTDLKFGRTANI